MRELVVRKLLIDLSTGFALNWAGEDAFKSAYFNALSMSFPVGEQFFIDSVRDGAAHLADGQQAPDVQTFIGQEASHRHIHHLFNSHLTQQGLPNHWARWASWRIERVKKSWFNHSPIGHLHALAITAAYEHCTAVFSDITLAAIEQPGDWFAGADPRLKLLWRWHAAEEGEHRAVAFDLYQQLGGSRRMRMLWFAYVLVMFSMDATMQTVSNLWHAQRLFKPSSTLQAFNFFLGRHGAVWRTVLPLLSYFRPNFHPGTDNHLADAWLQDNAQSWRVVGAQGK